MAYYKYSQILSRNNYLQLSHLCPPEDMEPGESRTVTVHVDERSLSYWYTDAELTQREDGTKDKWTVAEGTRKIYVGAASDNLILESDITVE